MTRAHVATRAAALATLIVSLAFLHDPAWAFNTSSGFRAWEEDPPGTLFRWTLGRATFFVPSDATAMMLPLRAVFPGPDGNPTTVDVLVDDRWIAKIELTDPSSWVRPLLPIGGSATHRRYRRVDLHINRTVGPFILGVMTGEPALTGTRTPLPRPRVGTAGAKNPAAFHAVM